MAFAHSPKIVTDGMVFYYDTGNSKSYKGEPTVNYISPEGQTFTQITTYNDMSHTQVVDSESPSGYACEMEIIALPVNNSARARFGFAGSMPTSGTAYVTVYAKLEGSTTANIRPAIYSGAIWQILEPLDGGSVYLTEDYRRFGVLATLGTGSGGPNPGFSMTYSNSGGAVGQKTRWHSPQVEVKSHATQFVNGTRSATEGLLDFTKNTTIDLTNVSFDSDALMTFDGSNDELQIDVDSWIRDVESVTIEGVVEIPAGASLAGGPWSIMTNQTDVTQRDGFWWHLRLGGGYTYFRVEDTVNGEQGITFGNPSSFSSGNTYHITTVVGNSGVYIYNNGVLVESYNPPFRWADISATNAATLFIGRTYPNYYLNSTNHLVKVYDRALTAEEIQQNYNTIKGRFGI